MNTSDHVDIEREDGGRFLAAVADLPGVLAYGNSADQALTRVQALALRVLADQLEHDEEHRGPIRVHFGTSDEA